MGKLSSSKFERGVAGVDLHREAPGYGIVRFNKPRRTITMECWPRYVDPTDPNTGSMYPNWPITLRQTDNYARKAKAWLPTLNVRGTADPVVQIIDEAGGEVVYTLRIRGARFRPKVFREGKYTIRVGQPDEGRFKTFRGVSAKVDNQEVMTISF